MPVAVWEGDIHRMLSGRLTSCVIGKMRVSNNGRLQTRYPQRRLRGVLIEIDGLTSINSFRIRWRPHIQLASAPTYGKIELPIR